MSENTNLRDQLAMAALIGMGNWVPPVSTLSATQAKADWAYVQADAMLRARVGGKDPALEPAVEGEPQVLGVIYSEGLGDDIEARFPSRSLVVLLGEDENLGLLVRRVFTNDRAWVSPRFVSVLLKEKGVQHPDFPSVGPSRKF